MKPKKIAMIQDKAGCRIVWLDQPGNDDMQTIQEFPNRVAMKRSAPGIAAKLGAELYNRKKSGSLVLIQAKPVKLSSTMQSAVDCARQNGGKLARYTGGCWMKPGLPANSNPNYLQRDTWTTTPTVRALVERKVFKETEWRRNSIGVFCVEVTLSDDRVFQLREAAAKGGAL